jgi:hypothetical protein
MGVFSDETYWQVKDFRFFQVLLIICQLHLDIGQLWVHYRMITQIYADIVSGKESATEV